MFKKIKYTILISILSFSFAFPVLAQDSEPDEPDVADVTEGEVDDIVGDVLSGLDDLIAPYIAVALPLVMVLVQLTKGLVPDVRADTLKRIWSLVVWVVFIFIARAGFADQFNTLVPALASILAIVTGIAATSEGSSIAFNAISDVPILGYSRTDPVEASHAHSH